eukprot:scaffold34685_cov183-Amphora_coffeaeformis.AAC.16
MMWKSNYLLLAVSVWLHVAHAFTTPTVRKGGLRSIIGNAGVAALSSRVKVHPLGTAATTTVIADTTTSRDDDDDDDDAVIFSTEENDKQETKEQFNWFKTWYPLVPVEILDNEKPHRFQLLGQDVVVWNDGPVEGHALFGSKKKRPKNAKRTEGNWRAFVDECPHRKVPLSEGRIEDDGTLLCSYHAWRFDGSGNCVSVPQLNEANSLLESIRSNPKTQCNAFPTKVINGVLFVWPSSDENAVLESELTPVPHRPSRKEEGGDLLWEGPWNFRSLPYGADYFIENVVDPAHVTVSHHNVVGDRYGNQEMKITTHEKLTKDGFSIDVRSLANPNPSTTNFIAPSLVAIDAGVGDNGARQTLELYVSPSTPGFCNHIGRMVIRKGDDGSMPKLLRTFTLPMPTWLNHVLASAFLNQDALFLHHQERTLAQTGQYKSVLTEGESPYHYTKAVYPLNSDKGVIQFRNWMRQLAGGAVPYKNNRTFMPAASNEVVFDVWNGHTKYCRYCQVALRRLKKARFASFVVATVLGTLRPWGRIGSLVATLFTAGVGLGLHKLIGMFYRYEFSHAHND